MGPKRWPVWLFVANLIGYARVALGVAAFAFAFDARTRSAFVALYVASYGLDALDGVAARALGQTSRFGAVLDMATDRVCTAGLLALLAHAAATPGARSATPLGALAAALQPGAWPPHVWVWLCMLDIFSHWMQTYSAQLSGAASHKALDGEAAFVRWYYRLPYGLFTVCLAHETFLMAALVGIWAGTPGAPPAPLFFGAALGDLRAALPDALQPPAWALPARPLLVFEALSAACLPLFAFKTLVSMLQLATAAQRVVAIDEAARGSAKSDASTAKATLSPAKAARSPATAPVAAEAAPGPDVGSRGRRSGAASAAGSAGSAGTLGSAGGSRGSRSTAGSGSVRRRGSAAAAPS